MRFDLIVKLKLKEQNISQTKLAKILGITPGYLSDIIHGKRNGGNYKEKIMLLLEIPTDYENLKND